MNENENEMVETKPIKMDMSKVTEEMTANLATAEAVVSLNKTYLKLAKNKAKRFLYTGLSSWDNEADKDTGEIKTVPCVVLMDMDKNMFITASHVIVNACKDLNQFAGIEIEYTGDKKLTGGKSLKEYRVVLLNS